MKTSDHLILAKERIATPKTWTKGHAARNKYCEPVDATDPDACSWCSWGTVIVEDSCLGTTSVAMESYLKRATVRLVHNSNQYIKFNDEHTHEQVMKLWDLAIELAKNDEE